MYSTFMSSKVVISPVSGSQITSADLISLLVPIPEAHVIRYTTDGTDPLPTSPIYTTPFTLPTGTRLVKAFVSVLGLKNSEISAASYIVSAPVPITATPVILPAAGAATTATQVSISCSTPTSAIHYTVDGSTPTVASPLYTVPFTMSVGTITVKAIGITTGYLNSVIATNVYTVSAIVIGMATMWAIGPYTIQP